MATIKLNNVSIATETAGAAALTVPSIQQTDAQNISGTKASHEMFMGKTFTLTGDLTVNDNLVFANLTGGGADITITDDGNGRTITTGSAGTLEGGEFLGTVPPETDISTMTSGAIASAITNNAGVASGAIAAGVTFPAGHVIQIVSSRPANYSSTTAYSSASLVPCAQQSITTKQANSSFLIHWNAEHTRSVAGRSQFLMADSYTAGTSNYSTGNYFFYSHYGWYHSAGGGNFITSYSYHDKSQTLAAGASITFYVFLGPVGSATDQASHQEIQVQEISA